MLLTIGFILLGVIALWSMIMMIGNVINKSPYGKGWALVGFFSVLFAGVLLVLQMIAPPVDEAKQEAAHEEEATKEPSAVKKQAIQGGSSSNATNQSPHTDLGKPIVTQADAQANADDLDNLSFLTTVLDYLKEGEPIPAEYLAMLPDGGQSLVAAQQNAVSHNALSQPLQSQLVSIQHSEGKDQYTGSSYVPTTPSAPASTGTSKSTGSTSNAGSAPKQPSHSQSAPKPAPTTKPSNSGNNTNTQPPADKPASQPTPTPKPAPQPAPEPTPPAEPTTRALLDGGLLKPLLGHSKSDVETFMQYSQSLGSSGNTARYLNGVTIIELTYSGNTVSKVKLQFNQFTPQGQPMSYYEDYMRGIAGMTNDAATSRVGTDITWRNVYAGTSSVLFHIDTNSNYGYVEAVR